MDHQSRGGAKTGSGGIAGVQESNMQRNKRLKNLMIESTDVSKDPYLMRNHLGSFECRLCLTLHNTEASYLAHSQGKKHQVNLQKRIMKEKAERGTGPQPKIKINKK